MLLWLSVLMFQLPASITLDFPADAANILVFCICGILG